MAVPVLTLEPHELVTDARLRELAQIDPLRLASGDDAVLLAGLSMELADMAGELLASRAILRKGLAPLSAKGR